MEDVTHQADDEIKSYSSTWLARNVQQYVVCWHGLRGGCVRVLHTELRVPLPFFLDTSLTCRVVFLEPCRWQGFNDGVSTVWEGDNGMLATLKALCEEEGKNRKLYISGHSLGGALATVAAARLAFEHDMKIDCIYTIGSPRYCVRSTNIVDAVPGCPSAPSTLTTRPSTVVKYPARLRRRVYVVWRFASLRR